MDSSKTELAMSTRRQWFTETIGVAAAIASGSSLGGASEPALDSSIVGGGLRVEWPRGMTKIRLLTEKETRIVEIVDPRGIGKATLVRESDKWPVAVAIRLHLKGLESFQVASPVMALEWSISSTGRPASRCSVRSAKGGERELKDDDPLFTSVKIVGKEVAIPLADGFFEVRLPAKWLDEAPAKVELRWIDFFRG